MKEDDEVAEEEEGADSPSSLLLALAEKISSALVSNHASETEAAAPAAVALRVIVTEPRTTRASKSTSKSKD